MKRIASAGIAVAAVAAAIAWGIWLGLPSRAPSPPAKPAAPSVGFRILRILDGETGAPALGAWVEFVAKEGFDVGEDSGAAWIPGGAGGIVRIPVATIESKGWESARVGAPDRPTIEIPAEAFRALILAEPPDAWISLAGEEVTGRVIDEDGNPLWGVDVSARGTIVAGGRRTHAALEGRELPWSFETQSAEEGRFRIRVLRGEGTGGPTIEFKKDGYLPASPAMPLPAGAVVTLLEEACVVGFVKDPQNSAIEGAAIEARPEVAEPAPGTMPPSVTVTTTGRDGSFEMRLAARFRYRIAARSRGYAPTEVGDVRPADGAYLDIVLHPRMELVAPSIRLLAGDPPAPVRDALVHVFFPILSDERLQHGKTDGEGRIRVVIPPGEVGRETVFVVPEIGFGQLEVLPFEDRDRQEWEVALQGGHNIDVAFVDAAGSPLEGVEVGLSVPSSFTQLGIFELHEIPHARYCSVHSLLKSKARSDASGRVAFRNLPADEYNLEFSDRSDVFPAPTSLYPKDIRVRSVRGMKGSRVVRQSPVTVRLLRAARILGTIIGPGGEPLPEAYVRLDGRYGLKWHHVGKSGTGEDGRFHIALLNVPEFSEDGAGRAIRGPSLKIYHDNFAEKTFVLARTPRAGETVDAGPIRLDPFATLIVQFPNLPVARWVGFPDLYRAEDETNSRWVQIEHPRFGQKEDRLYVRCLAAGTYRLTVDVLDHFPRPWESDPIPISPGETRTITAAIERGIELVGQVIDHETGAPIAGAGVHIRPDWWRRSSTRNEGRFHLSGLRPGPGVLVISRDGYSSLSLWMDVAEGLPEPIRMARIQESFEEQAEALPAQGRAQEANPPRPALVRFALAIQRPNGLLLRKGEGCAIEIDGSDERYGVAPPDDAGLRLADVPGEPGSRFRVWAETYLPSDWIEPAKLGSEMLEPARIHIRLKDGPCTRIAVRRSDGTPVESASVRIGYGRAAGVACDSAESDAHGEAALRPLPAGPAIIEVSGVDIVRESTRCEYDGRGGPIPVIAVRPAVLECSLRYAEEAVPLSAELGDREVFCFFPSPDLLRIPWIPPGTHDLRILNEKMKLCYARRTLAFAEGATVSTEIELPMGSIEGPASITRAGQVVERFPTSLHVRMRPLDHPGSNAAWDDTDPDGRFAFRGLPPGRYRVEWPEGPGVPPGREVEVRDGETTRVDLEVKTWTLRGTVALADGSPVRRAKVSLELPRVNVGPESPPSDDDSVSDVWSSGRFTFYEVAEGRQTLVVTASGFVPHRQVIDMDRDRTIHVVLEKAK